MAFRSFPCSFGPPSPMGTIKSPQTQRPLKRAPPKPRPASYHGCLRIEEKGASGSKNKVDYNQATEDIQQKEQNKVYPETTRGHTESNQVNSNKTPSSDQILKEEKHETISSVVNTEVAQAMPSDETVAHESLQNGTILYDPFEDKRIQLRRMRENTTDNGEDNSIGTKENRCATRERPKNLDLEAGGGSNASYRTEMTSFCGTSANRPSPGDSFRLTPLPVNDRREPPPPYEDTGRIHCAPNRRITDEANITRVIVPESAMPPEDSDGGRRLLYCHHCGYRVYTVVTKEYGLITHALALFFLLSCFLLPLIVVVYCTDYFKYKHHYCPNCNRVIGYEAPMTCQKIFYVK